MLRVAEPSSEQAPQTAAAVAVPATAGSAAREPVVRGRVTSGTVLSLQRSVGNAAVSRLLRQEDETVAPVDSGASATGTNTMVDGSGAGGEDADIKLDPITIRAQGPIPVEVFGAGPKLEGKTHAAYTSTDPLITPNPPKASKAPGGKIRAVGTVSSTFASNPTVDPYDLDSHGFTDCQHKNAEKFIKNTLDPHEQAHVSAYTTNFDGKWSSPFDLTVKDAGEATTQIKGLNDTEFAARKKKADDASGDLDAGGKNNFVWDMDEGCSDDTDKK